MAIGSHPISFHLLNLDNNSVLGIFDGKGQTSKLEIKNTSRREWLLSEQKCEQSQDLRANYNPHQ